jgi:L-gulonate 5-dehydrogenase
MDRNVFLIHSQGATMRAAIIDKPFAMHIGEWLAPQPKAGELLIATEAIGICAGDLYYYLGTNPYASYPQICGHEIAGIVLEAGPATDGPPAGSLVVVEPFVGCGACYPCRVGKPNCCANLEIIGVHRPGGYADYLCAPTKLVHQVPAGLSAFDASFAEPVAIAVQACRRGAVSANEYVLILGCGPIGLALIEVARARGAHVVATDIDQGRMATAAELGATVVPAGEALLPAILEQTNGEGAAVVIEATGNIRAIEQTVELVAAGGRIVVVGLVKKGLQVQLPGLDLTRKEMTILGSRASTGCFPEALELLATGAIRYPRLATPFSLWDAPQIFADLAAQPNHIHKGVLLREDHER